MSIAGMSGSMTYKGFTHQNDKNVASKMNPFNAFYVHIAEGMKVVIPRNCGNK
jgi:hypothetical protein